MGTGCGSSGVFGMRVAVGDGYVVTLARAHAHRHTHTHTHTHTHLLFSVHHAR